MVVSTTAVAQSRLSSILLNALVPCGRSSPAEAKSVSYHSCPGEVQQIALPLASVQGKHKGALQQDGRGKHEGLNMLGQPDKFCVSYMAASASCKNGASRGQLSFCNLVSAA